MFELDLSTEISALRATFRDIRAVVDVAALEADIERLSEQAGAPDLWDDPAAARAEDALPIGLAHRVRLRREVRAGARLRCRDVELDTTDPVLRLRETLIPTSD